MLISRKWLQTFFESKIPSAEELVDLFNTHAFEIEGLEKVGDDAVIDVDVLPNRSSDCLSHRGIARDVATILRTPLKNDPLRESLPTWETPGDFSITVEDEDLCPRYMVGVMRGVQVGPSPDWLRTALETIGQRSINNIVDATNYVLFNLGQPIHAFDLGLLEKDKNGKRNITIRNAKDKEQITTLTDDEYALSKNTLLITDGISDEPLALAGIKGGKHAEVTENTVDIAIEVANFNYVSVRKTANELKLHTDASLRFQNEVPERLAGFAMRDVVALIEKVASGKLVGVVDTHEEEVENMPIAVTLSEINTLLGLNLTIQEVEGILVRFEWEFSLDDDTFVVTGPWERTDLDSKEALIEEVGRIYGYKNITSALPTAIQEAVPVNKTLYYSEKMQHLFSALRYSEVLTYTIVDKGAVELENPFASDKAFMRMYLREGMYGALELNAQNAPVLGLEEVKLFEIGTVFTERGEELHLAVGVKALSRKQSKAEADLTEDVRNVFSEVGLDAHVTVTDGVCEVSLSEFITLSESPTGHDYAHTWDTEARFAMWSVYPYVLRDIAVWVPENVKSTEVLSEILNESTSLLVHHDLFDTYKKDGKVSYAWHLVFQSKERTLTDEEINSIMDSITTKLNKKDGWEVR